MRKLHAGIKQNGVLYCQGVWQHRMDSNDNTDDSKCALVPCSPRCACLLACFYLRGVHSLTSIHLLRPHSLSSNSRFSSSSCSIDAFNPSINPPRLHAYIIIIITTRTLFHPSPRYATFCSCCCCLAYALHHAAPGNEQGHHEMLDGHWRDILVQVGIPGFECGWWS